MNTAKTLVKEVESYINQYDSVVDIPAIEKDIVLQKIRNLYDYIKNSTETISHEEIISSIKPSIVETINEETFIDEQPVEEQPTEDVLFDLDEQEQQGTMDSVEEQPIVESAPEEPKEVIEVQEVTSKLSNSHTETFISKQSNDLGSKLGMKPVSDIFSALSINERYIYRSQLFQNNQELFLTSINKLNDSKSFDAAMKYIQDNFNWDFEDSIVQGFLQVVERRFLK